MQFIKIAILSILLTTLTGCAIPVKEASETVSPFDKTIELHTDRIMIFAEDSPWGGSNMDMSLTWRSAMKPDEITITVHMSGPQRIATGKSLQFNIDGEMVALESFDKSTTIGIEESTKRYTASSDTIRKIANSNKTIVKLIRPDGYILGYFLDPTKQAFSKFITRQATLSAAK